MTLPTIETVINYYLYGQSIPNPGAPERPADATSRISVDMGEYMNGPGRSADPARFYIVQDFFNAPTGTFVSGRHYSFSEVKATLETIHPEKHYTDLWDTHQYELVDLSTTPPELFERTFIYNSVQFKLGSATEFVVGADGNRSLQNWSVIPDPDTQENFDFESSDGFARTVNSSLRWLIDPDGIGRRVDINFVNPISPNATPYTQSDFARDSAGFVEQSFDDFINAIKDLGGNYNWALNNPGAVMGELPEWLYPVSAVQGMAASYAVGGGGISCPLVLDLDGDGVEIFYNSGRLAVLPNQTYGRNV